MKSESGFSLAIASQSFRNFEHGLKVSFQSLDTGIRIIIRRQNNPFQFPWASGAKLQRRSAATI